MGEEPKEGYMLTEHEVRDFCKGKIAHFKTPRLGLHEEGKIETAWFFGITCTFPVL
jgi:hypothetical protein